ncbi:S8 family serine peptidase [Candidatus Parcubacteria bacterium]|nr:S8 family serine peptidase [Candidatus Parcubacteria bacterium]
MQKLKTTKILLSCYLAILLILPQIVVAENKANNSLSPHKSGELLVKLKNSEEIYKFKFSSDNELESLINFYNTQPDVEYAEPNYIYKASIEPLDAYYPQQHYLRQIKAPQAWSITTGNDKITIAIIDSGVDIDHPDLKNNIWVNINEIPNNGIDDDENGFTDDVNGWDFIDNSNDPNPKLTENYSKVAIKHGTVVAGIVAAQSGGYQGIVGVTWNSKIMPLRVLDSTGVGDTMTVAKAIDYAREQKADIINLSFVGQGKSLTLEKSIQQAHNAGILIVAAAGNEVSSGINLDQIPEYPVCHDGPNGENWIIGVASINSDEKLGSFSNYGGKNIDLTAPGVNLFSAVYHDDNDANFKKYYESGWTGTSVSAPQVAGTAALIKSINPELSLEQIKDILLNSADNIDAKNDSKYKNLLGKGRLNVYNTILQAGYKIPSQTVSYDKIITSPGEFGGPHVRIYKKSNLQNQFFAYEENSRGNLSLAIGDLNNDSEPEIIIGLGAGTYPWIKVFDENSNLKNQFTAYAPNFRGGVEVAVGDVNGDGSLEIITGAGKGGGPHIRIFNSDGILINHFFAFDKKDRSGILVTAADINADGRAEIIAAKKSSSSEIKIFDLNGNLINKFLPKLNNILSLTAGNLNSDNLGEIIIGAGNGNEPRVFVFDKNGNLQNEFLAYAPNFKGGVFVAIGDVDADGQNEIVTGAGPGGGPHIRIFDNSGNPKFHFFAYDEKFRGGVKVSVEK